MSNITPLHLFKALSELTRLRCISLLLTEGELCVCELTYALELPQPKISHHLAHLRKVGLVSDRKSGIWIYYQINPQLPQWTINTLHSMLDGMTNHPPFNTDKKTLSTMANRPIDFCAN
jgi:ArsR family transcriptional regulator